MIKELLIAVVIYYWLVTVSSADVVKVWPCRKSREIEVKSDLIDVSIQPCPAMSRGICDVHRGANVTITARFTPQEVPNLPSSACKLKSKLVWVSKIEMDFGNISPNACDYMDCPLRPNTEHVFNTTIFVSKMWPIGSYPLKLKIQERSGPKRTLVCQLFKVNIADKAAEEVLS